MLKFVGLDRYLDGELREMEYLLTNGIGGYGSLTLTGRQTRKYHGVLVAALNPPVERYMGLSKLSETISIGNTKFNLNHYDIDKNESNESVCPNFFEKHWGAEQHYQLKDLKLIKIHSLVKGANKAIISYEIDNRAGQSKAVINIRPEFSLRDHHEVTLNSDEMPDWSYEDGILRLSKLISSQRHAPGAQGKRIKALHLGLQLHVLSPDQPAADIVIKKTAIEESWVGPYFLDNEAERGLETTLYHFAPVSYELAINPGEVLHFAISVAMDTQPTVTMDLEEVRAALSQAKAYTEHRLKHVERYGIKEEPLLRLAQLATLAADDFIVARQSTGHLSILAGYPWFTDWGRDSMIALPGLTLAAGNHEAFKDIFETFVSYMKSGILPNMFPDDGEEPIYNTVDATLWLPIAMRRYVEFNGMDAYAKKNFMPVLRDIIENYERGTLNNTYMDKDGLIWSGDDKTQLTWMDVKVNGWVVTPRHGKAVEINCLWYNCLMIAAELSQSPSEKVQYLEKAEKVKVAFNALFWDEVNQRLYDVVRGDVYVTEIRPNQIFAISLPYGLLTETRAKAVFEQVRQHLWIGCGLRSLSPEDQNYHGSYGGDVLSRDGAYHRGTGWGWLIGPYLDAFWALSLKDKSALNDVKAMLLQAGSVFDTLCVGQYPENFDGDSPYHGRGCMAQAWSVAEYLRWLMKVIHLEASAECQSELD